MLTPKMQMVGSRSAADLAFEGEGGGGTLVSGLQIYFCKYIFCLQIYLDMMNDVNHCIGFDSMPRDLLTFVFVVP